MSILAKWLLFFGYEVLMSLGYRKVLRRMGSRRTCYAWIPFVREYALAEAVVSNWSLYFLSWRVPDWMVLYHWVVSPICLTGAPGWVAVAFVECVMNVVLYIEVLRMVTYMPDDWCIQVGMAVGILKPFAAILFLFLRDDDRKDGMRYA